MMQAHFENGLSEHTLVAFNAFYHDYDRFNRSLPAHQRLSEGVMAEKLSHTIRRIGESVGTYLDVKLALGSATGRLAPTLAAIRDVLGELEAREYKRNVESGSSGRAFLARNPRNPGSNNANDPKAGKDSASKEKQRDPKRRREKPNSFADEWTPKFGTCRHCGGRHWHRDCKKNPKKNAANDRALTAAAAGDSGDPPEANVFIQEGSAAVTFSSSPDGRALCARKVSIGDLSTSPSVLPVSPVPALHEACDSRSSSSFNLAAQDEAELRRAEQYDSEDVDTSDTEYDPDRPYSLWENIFPDDDDGTIDYERYEDALQRGNEEYAEHRRYRAWCKESLARGDSGQLVELRRSLGLRLTRAQHDAARSGDPTDIDDIRRYARMMTRLDEREEQLSLPSSRAVLLEPSPIKTPGFRGYFAGDTPVPAEAIQAAPHLTTVQAAELYYARRAAALSTPQPAQGDVDAKHDISPSPVQDSTNTEPSGAPSPSKDRAPDAQHDVVAEPDTPVASPPCSPPPGSPSVSQSLASPAAARRDALRCNAWQLSFGLNALLIALIALLAVRSSPADDSGAAAFALQLRHRFFTSCDVVTSLAICLLLALVVWLIGFALRPTFDALRSTATLAPSLAAQASSERRLCSDFAPFESALDASLRAAVDLLVRARFLSLLLTLILVSVYAYLALGARLLNLQHNGDACSLPSRMVATIPWPEVATFAWHAARSSCRNVVDLFRSLHRFDNRLNDAVDAALCTLLDPLRMFALCLRACSLLLGARAVPREPFASRASVPGASAATPSMPTPATRAPRIVSPGPKSTAHALLAGRPRRIANTHARGTGQRGITFV
eukprot:6195911-Pleurochrysis_carterae.AAC.1